MALEFETVIGLEVHAQLKTETKIFTPSSTAFGGEPNSQTDPIVLGMPGVLPVLNARALEMALKAALALNCEIPPMSRFARKHYFYPDLPKGYQISQFEEPLALGGRVPLRLDGELREVELTRIHMEEDAGKLIHGEDFVAENASYVDLNRAGTPLIEIVSEPNLRTPEEAGEYMRSLRAILRYLEVCDGNMEEGSLRCDANVSLRPRGQQELGTKTELKNMNSFRNVVRALQYEIRRQEAILLEGGTITQETRLWDPDAGETRSMRGKEESHDYRYMPEPDLLPIHISRERIDEVRATLPELPIPRCERFIEAYGLTPDDAAQLTEDRGLADYFEAAAQGGDAKKACNWITTELLRELKTASLTIEQCPVPPEGLAKLLARVEDGTISGKQAKDVFGAMFAGEGDPDAIIDKRGLKQVSDTGALQALVDEVLASNPDKVEEYRGGKTKLLGFFVGQIMKASKGQANPQVINELLKKALEG